MRLFSQFGTVTVMLALLAGAGTPAWGKIEAVQGKRYTLTKQHGPWMIMVTTMRGETREENQRAETAADQLVYELRQKGIPAYVYTQGAIIERVDTVDREGRTGKKIMAARRNEFAVIAGNYDSEDNKVAHKTLAFIKRFRPKALEAHTKVLDAVASQMNQTAGDELGFKGNNNYGPMYKAFLVPNPLLTPEEIASRKKDPLLRSLNLGQENSIAENKGKYTLVVATFSGRDTIKPTRYSELESVMNDGALDRAAKQAWLLAKTMRSQHNLEAYVFHDKYRSVVTVGSFSSEDDPGVRTLIEKFRAKYRVNNDTKQEVLVSESIQIPGEAPGAPPVAVWVMDPQPQIIPVPRIR